MRTAPARFKLTCTSAVVTPGLAMIRRRLREAHALLNPALRHLNVHFIGDREMSQLHDQFMSMNFPTDVLTFPLEKNNGKTVEGEIAVCVPEARRRAKGQGISVPDELLLYALHGLLHLCGYNDLKPRDYLRMHAMEDQILTQLGVGPIFSRGRK